MDLLSRAVEELGLRRATFVRVEARGASGAREHAGEGPWLHVVERGRGALELDGRVVELEEGDHVIVPDGRRQRLRERDPAAPEEALVIASAAYELEAADHPMLASLGSALLVPRSVARTSPRLAVWLAALHEEAAHARPGSEEMVSRLAELMLVEVLRAHAEAGSECPRGGWFRGLRDPSLARALSAFHHDIAAAWTVERLAKAAGQSRSTFAARFDAVLGESPLGYVRRWRLFHARRLLRGTSQSLDEVARAVGYASAAALSLAFSRETGESPGAWRARRRAEPVQAQGVLRVGR